ncbi:MAG: MXAN_5187 family protein [Nannocystaceae bacterium]
MLLTKIWAAILACVATVFLAFMFLLSFGTATGFSDADRVAIQATTKAGIAALAAEIQASPVSRAPSILSDPGLKLALDPPPRDPKDKSPAPPSLEDAFIQVANELLLEDFAQMTVGMMDSGGNVLAGAGIAPEILTEIGKLNAYQSLQPAEENQFSATLGGNVQVVKVSRADSSGRRLVAYQPLDLGAGSFVRRVLGTDSPAGIVRDAKLLGSIIGDQPVAEEIKAIASEHGKAVPKSGVSDVFAVGEGLNARIGAIGRIPGPAGNGDHGTLLVVLSANTAAAGQKDLKSALAEARAAGNMGRLNWPLLLVFLAVTLGLAIYLPTLEGTGPIRRLTNEFRAMIKGTQQQLFYDTYSGPIGELAQAAVAYHETLRAALQSAELDMPPDGEAGASGTRGHRRVGNTRGHRALRTGAQQHVQEQPEAAPPQQPAGDPDEMPTAAHQAVPGRQGYYTMPATQKPLRSRETVIGNLMTLDADPSQPEPAKDDAVREAYYQEVFEEFIKFKVENNESTEGLTYDKFATKLRSNTAELMKRPDVKDVQFSVYLKDGKVALKARVVRG